MNNLVFNIFTFSNVVASSHNTYVNNSFAKFREIKSRVFAHEFLIG